MKKTNFFLVFISGIAAIGGFLFGFDMAVISGVLPLMQQQFELAPLQEGWLVSSALAGCIIGVGASGSLGDRLGRKKLLITAGFLFLLSTIGSALFLSFGAIIWARIIGGLGVGIASNIVPLYLSEIAPASKRGRYVTFYQLAVTMGILTAYLTNYGILTLAENAIGHPVLILEYLFLTEAWRGMFLVEALPALLFIVGLVYVPESPRWLIRKGQAVQARVILGKITDNTEADREATIIEQHTNKKTGSYRDLLEPDMRRPLILGLLLPLFSQFCGINAIIYYGPTILTNAGISLSNSFQSQIIFGVANMIFTFIAIWKVDQLGRRPLYLAGTAGASISLLLTGLFFFMPGIPGLWILITVSLFLASFAFSIGPLKFVVASEIFPTHIRARALGLSIMVMWIADAIVGQITAVMLREIGTSYTFLFFAFFCVVAFLTVYRLLPETKGKSLEEIEAFWKKSNTN